jgi:hypothetical protein
MNWTHISVVSTVSDTGAEDPVFDSLVLVGPFVIGSVRLLDRSVVSQGLAALYIAVFVVYVGYQAVQSEPDR